MKKYVNGHQTIFFQLPKTQRERKMADDRAKMTSAMKFDLIRTEVQDVCEACWDSPPMAYSLPSLRKPNP